MEMNGRIRNYEELHACVVDWHEQHLRLKHSGVQM
jgi:hypothetical protein